ncbi:MAG: DUF2459 domain-containing protein [Chitinophagaceae bacterium]|nr:DUF2459 domain-containing protein [Chitinophagaceae bacterium]
MRLLWSIWRLVVLIFDLLVLYFLFAIIGLFWPRNRDESFHQSGIPIIIHGDGFHTELYLPIEDSIICYNWFDFIRDTIITQKHSKNRYINFGWAEKDWSIAGSENKTGVLMAMETLLWPWNKSVMHVQLMDTVHPLKHPFTAKRILSAQQYKQLIAFITEGFVMKDNKPRVQSYNGYYGYDYFFSSNRNYNAVNTCNQWVADALNICGVRNPRFAPFGWSIAYQVKKKYFAQSH